MFSVDTGYDPLLKRPLSIHRITDGNLQFLYRVVGKGTDILSRKRAGETLEIVGPLGNEFPVGKSSGTIILVSGGLGIAPMFALLDVLMSPVSRSGMKNRKKRKVLLFYGARTKKTAILIKELKSSGVEFVISTDDGTLGEKGDIVTVLKNHTAAHPLNVTGNIIACGPKPMLRSVSMFAKKNKLDAYISLEENMACGVGACLGCVINTKEGYKRVCMEGPVFSTNDIVWK
jgi:dihydroorotate dehydrogenase electron transfer subunit